MRPVITQCSALLNFFLLSAQPQLVSRCFDVRLVAKLHDFSVVVKHVETGDSAECECLLCILSTELCNSHLALSLVEERYSLLASGDNALIKR